MVIGILLLIIALMFVLWKPWQPSSGANARTVSVTGEAKITAAPDEYVFYPSYEFKNADRSVALGDLSKKSDEVVGELKKLGVADASIKTNSDGYDYPIYEDKDTTPVYSLRLTITISNKDLAEKVQNYLVGTMPTGGVSPQYGFSDAKRKELETKAREEATKDARSKAEQSAKNLGFSVGKVKTVTDGMNFGEVYPMYQGDAGVAKDTASSSSLGLQPGENDLTYQVSVVYFVK
jgi:uncharacterized protein YggE